MMKRAGPARMVATLALAGLCSGLVLVGAYVATLPRIERNRAQALEAAIFRVLPNAVERKALVERNGRLREGRPEAGEEAIYAGFDSEGRLAGYAIPAQGPGFQDTIELIFGYDPRQARVTGMEVLQSRETPGLGDKIVKDEKFVSQFRAAAARPRLEAVKPGAARQPHEVDAISGATISSKAVVNIINQGIERWAPVIESSAPGREARHE